MVNESQNNNQDQQQTTHPADQQVGDDAPGNVRESKAFQALKNQLVEERNAAAQYKAQIENDRKAAEEKRLQEQGEFKTLSEQRATELETYKAEVAKDNLKRDLGDTLRDAGMGETLTRQGAIAGYSGDAPGVAEYVAKLKLDRPTLFEERGMSPADRTAEGGRSAGGQSKSLEERLKHEDLKNPKAAAEIRRAARAEKAAAGGYSK